MSILSSTNSGIYKARITREFLLGRDYEELTTGAIIKQGFYKGKTAFCGIYPLPDNHYMKDKCDYKFTFLYKNHLYDIPLVDYKTLLMYEEMIQAENKDDRDFFKNQFILQGKVIQKLG